MEQPTNNLHQSLLLWVVSQIMYILSIVTNLDLMFKVLSWLSITMVVIINAKNFLKGVKGIFKKRR